MGCLGIGCRYLNVEVTLCDRCGSDAIYNIDGDDYCEDCAEKYLTECFNDMSIEDRAKAVGADFTIIDE